MLFWGINSFPFGHYIDITKKDKTLTFYSNKFMMKFAEHIYALKSDEPF